MIKIAAGILVAGSRPKFLIGPAPTVMPKPKGMFDQFPSTADQIQIHTRLEDVQKPVFKSRLNSKLFSLPDMRQKVTKFMQAKAESQRLDKVLAEMWKQREAMYGPMQ